MHIHFSRLLIGFVSIFILVLPTVFAKTTSEEVGTVIVGLKNSHHCGGGGTSD